VIHRDRRVELLHNRSAAFVEGRTRLMTRPSLTGSSSLATCLPRAAIVIGDLAAREDLLVEGVVSGSIDMPGFAITIAAGARVDARILARDVTVLGTVTGRITATEIIDVRAGARVTGELAAPSVALAEGAEVQARIETKSVEAAVHVARYRMARAATS
jgi:cytoskeletal protein CcmA (bactofilin family)